jgi:hypothetical protein
MKWILNKKSVVFTTLFFTFYLFCIAQIKNKVANPSFEQLTSCNCSNMYAIGWNLFGFNSNSVACNACCIDSNSTSTPKNNFGFQYPKHGNGYSLFDPIGNPYDSVFRGYLQSKLIKKLKNKYYHIYIYVSLIEISTVASSNIQIAFTDNINIINKYGDLISFPLNSGLPQIKNSFTNTITDSINWVKIGGAFKAKGTENYITIGNFYDNTQTDTLPIKFGIGAWPSNSICGYYVDDIHLTEEDRAEAYFDTTKTSLCIQQGIPKVLGDTAVRPWLTYVWRDSGGNVVGNNRNYTYNAANLGQTFFTVSISDTAEDAFITKTIDTIFIDVSLNPDTANCNAVYIDEVLRDAEGIDLYFSDNAIKFSQLHERFVGCILQLKSIDGNTIFKTRLERKKDVYVLQNEIGKGFYFVEVVYEGKSIKRKKVIVD